MFTTVSRRIHLSNLESSFHTAKLLTNIRQVIEQSTNKPHLYTNSTTENFIQQNQRQFYANGKRKT